MDAFNRIDTFKSALAQKIASNDQENFKMEHKETINSLYENLKLEHLSNKVIGGERERLDIGESNFSRLSKMDVLHDLARQNAVSQWKSEGYRDKNIDINNKNIFQENWKIKNDRVKRSSEEVNVLEKHANDMQKAIGLNQSKDNNFNLE
jgi:hypothetical protein